MLSYSRVPSSFLGKGASPRLGSRWEGEEKTEKMIKVVLSTEFLKIQPCLWVLYICIISSILLYFFIKIVNLSARLLLTTSSFGVFFWRNLNFYSHLSDNHLVISLLAEAELTGKHEASGWGRGPGTPASSPLRSSGGPAPHPLGDALCSTTLM